MSEPRKIEFLKAYLGNTRHKSRATFSQFFLDEQNIRHESSGIISLTKPPKWSGSKRVTSSLYCKQRNFEKAMQKPFQKHLRRSPQFFPF